MITKRRTRRHQQRTHRRHLKAVWLSAFALTMAAGCGTQVDDARITAVGNGYNAQASAVPLGTDVGAATAPGAVPAAGAANTGAVAPGSAGNVPVAAGAGQATTTAGAGTKTTAGAQQPGAVAPGGQVAGPAPCTKPLSPIVLGQTLATSGLIGSTIGNLRQGVAIWAKDVNARGGIECHPVQVTSLDDGSDSARVASNWNTLKAKGMVAMIGAGEPITIGALRASAERDKIPVIGGDVVALDWFQSPYIFPQGGDSLSAYDGSTVEAAKAVPGAKTAGIIYCVEASVCTDIKNNFPNSAKLAGLTAAVSKAVSLTQSDYTAECQAFKDAKVDVLWLALDGSANTRLARSCAQLNYFPQLATSAIGIPPAAAADPALQKNTVYLGGQNVPFTTTDTPGAAEFNLAVKKWAPSFTPDGNTMAGWASGKLLETALAKESAKARAGNVTTEMILDGLWQLKNEKLNGLVPGLTFTKGAPAKAPRCYFTLLLNTKGVTAPLGSKINCLKD